MRQDIILGKLPDPFVFDDGSRVKSAADWPRRREEILSSVIRTEFGGMPPQPEAFRVEALDVDSDISVLETMMTSDGLLEQKAALHPRTATSGEGGK